MGNKQLTVVDKAMLSIAPRYRHAAADDNLAWAQEKLHATAIIMASKDLKNAIPATLESAVLQAGSMGLTLNPQKKHCYIIPRKANRKDPNAPIIAYASPSYMGLCHLLVKEGMVKFIRAQVVYQWDTFTYCGPIDKPVYHAGVGNLTTETKATGVYAVAKTADGDILCEYMDRATVQRIRGMSEMSNGAIWHPDKLWTEGWKKAVIRRFVKTLPDAGVPNTPRVDAAITSMNEHEGIEQAKDITPETVELINDEQVIQLQEYIDESGLDVQKIFNAFVVEKLADLPANRFNECLTRVKTYYNSVRA